MESNNNTLKRILQLVVSSMQKSRSILEENEPVHEIDLLLGEESWVFQESTEKLMFTWNNLTNPTAMEVYNAINWIRMKDPGTDLLLGMRMQEAGLIEYNDNPVKILEDFL